ncbi:Tc5 transposase DNA-binding domain [Popillia japonica]|uniref:Tc5 transposase DNA-binding domain n=1 Tax=Popillia japonica TaxID=7064 RepID=A0AAW1K460_POPJA
MCAQKSIDISAKLKILEEVETGTFSKTKITERYKIAKSTLSTIIKYKEKIDAAVAAGSFGSMRHIRKASHKDIENELLAWFKRARNSNVSISGPLMKEKAKEVSVSIGIDNFQSSDGWLWRFQKRYKISSHVVSGETNKVNENDITEWLKYFYGIRRSYDEKDIFKIYIQS